VTYHAPLIQCGQAIDADTTLTRDLDCRGIGTGPALVVGDPRFPGPGPVVLDLGGHTVRGPLTGTGVDFQTPGTVRDGTLRGFRTGVSVHALDGHDQTTAEATVSRLRIDDGTFGVYGTGVAAGVLVHVDHSSITRMTDSGVYVGTGYHGEMTVTDTTVTHSGEGVGGQLTNATLQRDVLTGNTFAGADVMADAVTATGDTITGNGRGLVVLTPVHDFDPYPPPGLPGGAVTITGNTVSANTTGGIALLGRVAAGSVLSADQASGNGSALTADGLGGVGDGIAVVLDPPDAAAPDVSAADLAMTGNTARANAAWGIDAPGVTDGGTNRASGNAPGEDCRGVTCTR